MPNKAKKFFRNTLERGSSFLSLDLNYFLSGGFWSSIPVFTDALANLLIIVLFTNMASQEVYGEYRFFLSVLGILTLFAIPGTENAIIQSVSKGHEVSFLEGTKLKLKLSFLGSFGFLFCAGYMWFIGKPGAVIYFLFVALIFPLMYSFGTFNSYLVGKERYKAQSIYSTAQILTKSILFALAIIFLDNLALIIIVFTLAMSISNLISFLLVKKKHAQEIRASRKDPGMVKYAIHLTAMQFVPAIAGNLDKILLTYFLGFKMLALFAVAQTIAQQSKLAIRPFFRLILPKLSRQKDALKTYNFLKGKIFYMIGASLFISLVGILLTPYFIRFFFPPEYEASILLTQILFVGTIFVFANVIFTNYLLSQKMTSSLYKTNIYPFAIRIVLLLLLLPLYGVYGAVISEILGNFVLFGMLIFFGRKDARKSL